MMKPAFLAVNWGGTSFRVWAVAADGTILQTRSAADGLKSVENRQFGTVLRRHCGDWLAADARVPLVMNGMVGARDGWIETAYAPCPLRFDALTQTATRFELDQHPVVILPGATATESDGNSDVMRGEEVQIFGAAYLTGMRDAVICIPGTHSKWAVLRDSTLSGFRTFVTGEVFALLLNTSLVGALAKEAAFDANAFRRGLDRGAAQPLSHAVFAARASTLTGALAPTEVASFLSGVLIGAECAAQDGDGPVVLMASGVLADRYGAALSHFGRTHRLVDAGAATLAGLTRAARALWPTAMAA